MFLIKVLLVIGLIVLDVILLKSIIWGAPFAPTKLPAVMTMIEHLSITPGDKAVDLGSGDGRIVIALAQAGAEAHGYETNPLLVWWSRLRIWQAGLQSRAFIHQKSYWHVPLDSFSVVTVFGIPHIMKKLAAKLQAELHDGSVVLANTYTLPDWKPQTAEHGVYIYTVPDSFINDSFIKGS